MPQRIHPEHQRPDLQVEVTEPELDDIRTLVGLIPRNIDSQKMQLLEVTLANLVVCYVGPHRRPCDLMVEEETALRSFCLPELYQAHLMRCVGELHGQTT